ncbi:hypothetical protein [Aeromonas caviae]|uniref:hypothetical protein n=1 Tax=Aeromonas caviae TaxID=648 RepID=UPI00227EDAFA|nr:hypothetical protein [Aeromonas caviae]MCY9815483.1 hypothetical protein [Aeromonas caviae]
MSEKEQLSRQQQSARKRKEAGLTPVKVYLDQATLQLLELLQKNVMGEEVKGDEQNLSRSSAVIASIHTLARERLDEDVIARTIAVHLGGDYPKKEPFDVPSSFMLRAMINRLYVNCRIGSHNSRLKSVAEDMNSMRFRNTKGKDDRWSDRDISRYVSNDLRLEQ